MLGKVYGLIFAIVVTLVIGFLLPGLTAKSISLLFFGFLGIGIVGARLLVRKKAQ